MKTVQSVAALGVPLNYLGLPTTTEDFYRIEYYFFHYDGIRFEQLQRLQLIALCFSHPEEKATIDIRFLRMSVDHIDEDYHGWLDASGGFLMRRDDCEALVDFLQVTSESRVVLDDTDNRQHFAQIDPGHEKLPTPFEILFTSNNYMGNRDAANENDSVRYERVYVSYPLMEAYQDDLAIIAFSFSRYKDLSSDSYLAFMIYTKYQERYKDVGLRVYDGDTTSLSKVAALRFSKQSLQEFATLFREFVGSTHFQKKTG